MEQNRLPTGRSQGVEHHQSIVDCHLAQIAGHHQPRLAVVGCAHQKACRLLPPAELEHRLALRSLAAYYLLSFLFLTHLLGKTDSHAVFYHQMEEHILIIAGERFIVGHQLKVVFFSLYSKDMPGHLIIFSFHKRFFP